MKNSQKLHSTLLAALVALQENWPESDDGLLDQDEVSDLIDQLRVNPDPTIQAVLSGGLFRSASCDHPIATMFGIEMLDFDIEGTDAPDYLAVPASEWLGPESSAGVFLRGEGIGFGKDYVLEEWQEEEAV